MTEWSVDIDLEGPIGTGDAVLAEVDELLSVLEEYAAVASHDATSLSIRLCVEASGPAAAGQVGIDVVQTALRKIPVLWELGLEPVRFQVETLADLARRVERRNYPELLGVAEVASFLGVSKQRVSELARSSGFPKPFAELASGPVWRQSALERHVGRWDRRPGRPRKAEPAPPDLARIAAKAEERAAAKNGRSGSNRKRAPRS